MCTKYVSPILSNYSTLSAVPVTQEQQLTLRYYYAQNQTSCLFVRRDKNHNKFWDKREQWNIPGIGGFIDSGLLITIKCYYLI